jgi:hypothetical protein
MKEYSIRQLEIKEVEAALSLVWKVFEKFEAPDYIKEGVDEFRRSVGVKNS